MTDMIKCSMKIMALAVLCLFSTRVSFGQDTLPGGSDEQMMREWIKVLASDEFGGRKPMTEHEDLTINYLADQLKGLGLEPAFDGSWFQPFGMLAVTAKPVGGALTAKGKKKVSLRYPEDAIVWTARATDMVELKSVEYVFCGFGINAPEYGWNDYEGIDVKGKIVIAMVNDPGYYDSKLFRGRNMTYYGRWLYKFEEAKRQMEQCEHKCAHEGDTAMCCKAEGMAQDTTACCKKAEGEKCCKKAEGEKCCKEAAK